MIDYTNLSEEEIETNADLIIWSSIPHKSFTPYIRKKFSEEIKNFIWVLDLLLEKKINKSGETFIFFEEKCVVHYSGCILYVSYDLVWSKLEKHFNNIEDIKCFLKEFLEQLFSDVPIFYIDKIVYFGPTYFLELKKRFENLS